MVKKGRAIAFSYDALLQSNQLSKLVINGLTWATKINEPLGRTCLDPSRRSINFSILNESIDHVKSDRLYPKQTLTTLQDLAEMACRQAARYPGEPLSGATVDVSAAYNQFHQSVNSALTHAVRINVLQSAKTFISIVIIFLVGMFGYGRTGNVYGQFSQAISELHNMHCAVIRSKNLH